MVAEELPSYIQPFQLVGGDLEGFQGAQDVDEPELDEGDVVVANGLEHVVGVFAVEDRGAVHCAALHLGVEVAVGASPGARPGVLSRMGPEDVFSCFSAY